VVEGYWHLQPGPDNEIIVAFDPDSPHLLDMSVPQEVYDMANGIRDYIQSLPFGQLDMQALEFLYNQANRFVSNWLAGTIVQFLQALDPIFQTFLGNLVHRALTNMFGNSLDAFVTWLNDYFNGGNAASRRLSAHTLVSYPFWRGPEEQYGGLDFPTYVGGVEYDSTNMCMSFTHSSIDVLQLPFVQSTYPMHDGPTVEMLVRRWENYSAPVPIFCTMNLGNSNSSVPLTAHLSWYGDTGVQLDVGPSPIVATHASIDVSNWVHVLVMRLNGQWHLQVAQQGNKSVLASLPADAQLDYGLLSMTFSAGPTTSVWHCRNLVVSSGAEYDLAAMPTMPGSFWNHGADDYTGVPHSFDLTGPTYMWKTGAEYEFDGLQDAATTFDVADIPLVVGSKMNFPLATTPSFTMEFDFIGDEPTASNSECVFCFGDYPYTSFEQYAGGSYYIRTTAGAYVEWTGYYTSWTTLRLTLDTSLKLYINDELKAEIQQSQLTLANFSQSLYLGIFYSDIYPYTGKMRNFKYYA